MKFLALHSQKKKFHVQAYQNTMAGKYVTISLLLAQQHYMMQLSLVGADDSIQEEYWLQ